VITIEEDGQGIRVTGLQIGHQSFVSERDELGIKRHASLLYGMLAHVHYLSDLRVKSTVSNRRLPYSTRSQHREAFKEKNSCVLEWHKYEISVAYYQKGWQSTKPPSPQTSYKML
jgi:hypothetical protein